MEATRVIYQNEDGGVSVVVPAPKSGLTLEQIIERAVPQDAAYQIIDVADLPVDRVFRNAWRVGQGRVDTDLPAAKDIVHEKRRAKREEELAPLDDIIAKQIPGYDLTEVEAQRQAIRDENAALQLAIDNAQNETALRAILATVET